eukprot:6113219-Pyramimonas_sp.AAC.1
MSAGGVGRAASSNPKTAWGSTQASLGVGPPKGRLPLAAKKREKERRLFASGRTARARNT